MCYDKTIKVIGKVRRRSNEFCPERVLKLSNGWIRFEE